MNIIDLGLIRYAEADALQRARLEEVAAGAEETLYLLEHHPVITLGRNGGGENLHVGREWLAAQSIDLVQSSRGGNITCHFPGQLVAYPVFRVAKRPGGLRQMFHDLEEVVITTLGTSGFPPPGGKAAPACGSTTARYAPSAWPCAAGHRTTGSR